MYADTITLFNRYSSKLGDMWLPTVITGADLNTDRAAVVAKYGESSADKATLHIRYEVKDGAPYVAKKRYLSPKAWEAQTNDQLADTLTFTPGQDFDFFWAGAWPGTEPINDEEYPEGFYAYMNRKHDGVYAITNAAMYSAIPHFEIGGK